MNYQMTKFKIEPGPNQEIISYDVWYDGMVYIIDMMVQWICVTQPISSLQARKVAFKAADYDLVSSSD